MSVLEGMAAAVLSSYDLRQNEERSKERRAGEPDEEGWVTVRGKRKASQPQTVREHYGHSGRVVAWANTCTWEEERVIYDVLSSSLCVLMQLCGQIIT